MRRLLPTIALAGLGLVGPPSVAQKITCAPYLDARRYYEGPDNQFLSIEAFSSAPIRPEARVLPYLSRLVEAIRARGTVLVAVIPPSPGFAFAGRLDAARIANTPFEAAASPTNLPALLGGYRATLELFGPLGVPAVDLMTPMLEAARARPNESLFWKRDYHWHPNGARVAASAVAAFLREREPALAATLRPEPLEVVTASVVRQTSLAGWDWQISRACSDHRPVPEDTPQLELRRKGGEPRDLFGDQDHDVVIVGSSYSSAPPEFGFGPYLSEALGHEVMNASVIGGGAIVALHDYYLAWKPEDVEPKFLLWEFPVGYISGSPSEGMLSVENLRQLLPAVASRSTPTLEIEAPARNGARLDVSAAGARGPASFLDVSFDELLTRELHLTLTYDDGEEVVTLLRTRGSVLDRFLLELSAERGALRSVHVEALDVPDASEGPLGRVFLKIRRYGS